jgi:hypothetical protein
MTSVYKTYARTDRGHPPVIGPDDDEIAERAVRMGKWLQINPSYLVVMSISTLDSFKVDRRIPSSLRYSSLGDARNPMHESAWEESLKAAMRLSVKGFGEAMAEARHVLIDYGHREFSLDEVYKVADWLHDLYGAIISLYGQLDGRPYDALVVHRLIRRDALFLQVYPPQP